MGGDDPAACTDHPCAHETDPARREGRRRRVPREVRTPIVVPTIDSCEIEKYPRYVVIGAGSGPARPLELRMPGTTRAHPVAFDEVHWQLYLDHHHLPIMSDVSELDAPASSAQAEEVELPCTVLSEPSTVEGAAASPIVATFDPTTRWRWQIFGLGTAGRAANPLWHDYVCRTLMLFPRQFLERTHLNRVVFDFRVGNPHLGYGTPGHMRASIGDGGTNKAAVIAREARLATRRRAAVAARTASPGTLLAAYATLNRWSRRHPYPAGEAEIDAYYDVASFISPGAANPGCVDNFFHEFGHMYNPPGAPSRFRTAERIWGLYFCGLANDGYGGLTKGPSEAFSEAVRFRLSGNEAADLQYTTAIRDRLLADTHTTQQVRELLEATEPDDAIDLQREVEATLDRYGFPTSQSMLDARRAIAIHPIPAGTAPSAPVAAADDDAVDDDVHADAEGDDEGTTGDTPPPE